MYDDDGVQQTGVWVWGDTSLNHTDQWLADDAHAPDMRKRVGFALEQSLPRPPSSPRCCGRCTAAPVPARATDVAYAADDAPKSMITANVAYL